jgi:hypothetical protein
MIYSTRHPRHLPELIVYPVQRSTERSIWDMTGDLVSTAEKLKAIGIDPAFLCSDTIDFDYEAALTEFQEDYNIMFPEDNDEQS